MRHDTRQSYRVTQRLLCVLIAFFFSFTYVGQQAFAQDVCPLPPEVPELPPGDPGSECGEACDLSVGELPEIPPPVSDGAVDDAKAEAEEVADSASEVFDALIELIDGLVHDRSEAAREEAAKWGQESIDATEDDIADKVEQIEAEKEKIEEQRQAVEDAKQQILEEIDGLKADHDAEADPLRQNMLQLKQQVQENVGEFQGMQADLGGLLAEEAQLVEQIADEEAAFEEEKAELIELIQQYFAEACDQLLWDAIQELVLQLIQRREAIEVLRQTLSIVRQIIISVGISILTFYYGTLLPGIMELGSMVIAYTQLVVAFWASVAAAVAAFARTVLLAVWIAVAAATVAVKIALAIVAVIVVAALTWFLYWLYQKIFGDDGGSERIRRAGSQMMKNQYGLGSVGTALAQNDIEPSDVPPPGPSCEGFCGGPSDDGCWCDDLCTQYGDCCDDYATVCQ